jgi:hypothetical protein
MVSAFKILLPNTGADRHREREREIGRKEGREGGRKEGKRVVQQGLWLTYVSGNGCGECQ